MTSETRAFNGVGSYQLSYGYNLAGELTGMTNPWGVWTGYSYDNNGRLNRVHADGSMQNVTTYAYDIKYRAFGAVKSMSFGDHQSLSTSYDERMRPTSWNVSNVLGYNYNYDCYYCEHTGRVTYAQSIYDPTLDRSYNYDQVGALQFARSGAEARATVGLGPWYIQDGPYSHQYDYDQFGNMTYRHGWGGEVQGGTAGQDSDKIYTYSNVKNQRDGFTYDAAGNLRNDLAYAYEYDSIGQQVSAASNGYVLLQGYDGDGLRAQKIDNGAMTLYIRSAVLGGAVVAEIDGSGNWSRGYVYQGDQLLAIQSGGQLSWVHEDAITKSQRVTDVYGNVINTVELDPWGANTNRSSASAFQPQNFTTYIRDGNGEQDAMARRYSVGGRFSQPDPYGGSYNFGDPQSLNRYAYVGNDPVNRSDPSGMMWDFPEAYWGFGHFASGFWGSGSLIDRPRHTGRSTIAATEFLFTSAWLSGRYHSWGEGFSRNLYLTTSLGNAQDTDCQRFANIVSEIAGRNNTTEGFMDEMARTFTAANNSSRAEMGRNLDNPLPSDRIQIGDAGFRAEYRDGTNLQVRHFVGGLLYGYRYGFGGPFTAGAILEGISPAPSGSMADVRLNNLSMHWGNDAEPRAATVTFGERGQRYPVAAHPGYRGLAALIRTHICE